MDRKVVLASLKAITYGSGRAYVALSKGDTADQEIIRYHTEEDE